MKITIVMILLLIGCLAAIAQCRFVAGRRSYVVVDRARATIVAVNTTSLDESKLTVKFCTKSQCTRGKDPDLETCFSCRNLKGQPCFFSEDECKSKCPPCDPVCPPPPANTDEQMQRVEMET
ncbi:hypothetical protein CFC21_111969 [Triticum aestivum]|uniref:Bowman-Birk serine protease inhibitors family domain-containing protein n=2 Tax=Triticum aestivum TaxID=4565 RepID=A0A3B6TZR0_WHEAT|nr:hypothetical protein CFC21_111969 [Triticum aestivum]